MRIPKTSIRTTWKADWLIEFSIALVVVGILTREWIFAAVGTGGCFALVTLCFIFSRRLSILRSGLQIVERLSRSKVFLGGSLEGELKILNACRITAQILTVQPVLEKALTFQLQSALDRLLQPGSTASSRFMITPFARGRFQISAFVLMLTDSKGLFTGELRQPQADWIEVYPSTGVAEPLTPLALYGGRVVFLRSLSGDDYAGIRQYAPGDEFHRIEWKATARLRTLMVEEFHPERETTLQILIDAGKTMQQRSYVGTRLDEALAAAGLLTESASASRTQVGIYVYNESGLAKALRPTTSEQQLTSLRELSLALQGEGRSVEPALPLPAPKRPPVASMPTLLVSERVVTFMRLLRLRLGLGYRQTGVYRALKEATLMGGRCLMIVLTDLQTNNEALLEAASAQQERGVHTVIAQIGAAWRLRSSPEEAYVEYQRNSRILRRIEELGLTAFDLRPESLVQTLAQHVGKFMTVATGRQ